jgi:phosphopentomutase
MSRFVFMVLDGVGAGALPDAAAYGDAGSDTLGNLSRVTRLHLPFLERLGLGNIVPILGVPPVPAPLALTGRLATLSAGKDTTVGHWEHMGLATEKPFPTYPDGFPDEVLRPFVERIGREVLGNRPASGTTIIAELGAEHLATGRPIVYTSADSVFQVAAHTDVVPLEQLYEWCAIARELLQGSHAVARVIARPFTGRPGAFVRTKDRRDFSLAPPGPTYLDLLHDAGVPVLALGKVGEVFVDRGVTAKIKVASNDENLSLVRDLLRGSSERARFDEGLLFTNLVDFDMVWGHRNDVDGFAAGLAAVDAALPDIVSALEPADALLVTADHGVDPTTVSTDHSREYVPLLLYPRPPACPAAVYEGTLADTGASVFAALTGRTPPLGGDPVSAFRPSRGWRRCTPAISCPTAQKPAAGKAAPAKQTPEKQAQPAASPTARLVPGRAGHEESADAARHVREALGEAPEVAVVLGSGLADALHLERGAALRYREIPGWAEGEVLGHPYRLSLARWKGRSLALLEGRVHGYEGFDLSQLQLPMWTLARWGVGKVLLTSACGAVAPGLRAGDVVIAREMLDLETALLCGLEARPQWLAATPQALVERVLQAAARQSAEPAPAAPAWLSGGMHACVPGPHYETDAEVELLRALGVAAVSMSGTPELLALRDEGLEVAALSLIVNAGHTSHGGVLAGAAHAAETFTAAVQAVLTCWGY